MNEPTVQISQERKAMYYGPMGRPVCVRYRYDADQHNRFKTAALANIPGSGI